MNKTTYFFTSIRDSNNSRGCVKILEIPEGRKGGTFWGSLFGKSRGEGGLYSKSLLWGLYGYVLEQHNCWNFMIITVILLLLHPASLMHKSPQRCKIIDCMHPIRHKDRSIGMKMFSSNILFDFHKLSLLDSP